MLSCSTLLNHREVRLNEHSDFDREVIRVAELFERLDRQPDPVAAPKIEALPLHERLTPSNFEKLIARLAAPPEGVEVQAFRYGKSGSTQGGVDVICIDPVAQKCDCYEGKRVKAIRQGQISAWIDKFLSGPLAVDARSFHLCTTYPIAEDTDLLLEWKECTYLLASKAIRPLLWDLDELHRMLRRRRDIVSELFGDAVADGFCPREHPELEPPPEQSFDAQAVSVFGRTASFKNVSVACELFLPAAEDLSLCGIFSFARKDLSGTTISVSGQELVRWMQWRSQANGQAESPYAIPLHSDQSRYVLQAKAARLILNEGELNDLHWILARSWHEFIRSSKEVLSKMRCHRFKQIPNSDAFGLISVRRDLWRAMLAYASEHDFAKGDSDWHCFDGAPGCVKVYTDSNGARFDRGYHAILYAYNESGIWMPWERSVIIGWEAPIDLDGSPSEISPRKSWDAEYTHDWLLKEFIPEVLRWDVAKAQPEPKGFLRAKRHVTLEPPRVESVAHTRASGPAWTVVPSTNRIELLECIQTLQAHANGRRVHVPIPAQIMRCLYHCIDRTLPFLQLSSTHYLRSSLRIGLDSDIHGEVRHRAAHWNRPIQYTELDFTLRALIEVLEPSCRLPDGELANIASSLQPVLDRYHEDVLCDIFSRQS